ncbi:hypothetical protein [Methanomethylophilus alvi]|uniref:hypothetical protein n=1 Tax=Methanomethylophilus alvi TaxID=1291540 RepID=UPI0037DD9FB8
MSVKQITYENIDPKVRSMIMVGLTLAMLIACLDGTIVSTCGATIASELNGTALCTPGWSRHTCCARP